MNNAGITRDGTLLRMRRDMWDAVLDTNLGSCYNLCKLTFEGMRDRKFGRIVNVGSVNGQAGQYGQVNYAAAKSGIHGFTKALAQEGARYGITVNAIAPGYVDTEMVRAVPGEVLAQDRREDPDRTPWACRGHCPRRRVPDRRRRRFRYWIDAVDQRRHAYVLRPIRGGPRAHLGFLPSTRNQESSFLQQTGGFQP